MLEKKHGMFDGGSYTLRYHSGDEAVEMVLQQLRSC